MKPTTRVAVLLAALLLFPLRGLAAVALEICAADKLAAAVVAEITLSHDHSKATDAGHHHAGSPHASESVTNAGHAPADCLAMCGLCAAHCAAAVVFDGSSIFETSPARATAISFKPPIWTAFVPLLPDRPPTDHLR